MLHLYCHIGAPHLHAFNCHLLAKILWRSIICAFFTLPKRPLFPCTCANKIWCYDKFYWNWKWNTEPCWWKLSIFRSCLPYLNQVTILAYSFQMEINLCSAPHSLFHSSQKRKGAFGWYSLFCHRRYCKERLKGEIDTNVLMLFKVVYHCSKW